MRIHCPNCAFGNYPEATVCDNCGAILRPRQSDSQRPAQDTPASTPPAQVTSTVTITYTRPAGEPFPFPSPSVNAMRQHVTVLGWLFVARGILGLLGMSFIMFVYVGIPAILDLDLITNIVPGVASLMIVFGIGAFLLLLVGPDLLVGYGLLRCYRWARILAAALGILSLPLFPLGTAIGIYVLVVLLNRQTITLFADEPGTEHDSILSNLVFFLLIAPVATLLFIALTLVALAQGWIPREWVSGQ